VLAASAVTPRNEVSAESVAEEIWLAPEVATAPTQRQRNLALFDLMNR